MEGISVVIVTYGRKKLLAQCLKSISESRRPKPFEIIVVINGQDEETLLLLSSYQQILEELRFFSIGKTTNAAARNRGIESAQKEILYFLDDDVTVEKDIFVQALRKFNENKTVVVIGGPNLTPGSNNLFQQCSGFFFSSLFGSGPTRFRYKKQLKDKFCDDKALILCNLAIRKEVLEKEKLHFKDDFLCNEENLLLQQIKSRGHKLLSSPSLIVYHDRRVNLKEFTKQIFKYGRGRMQQTLCLPASLPLLNLLPIMFILYSVSLVFFHQAWYLVLLVLYMGINVLFSLQGALKQRDLFAFFILMLIFPLAHFAYGAGFIRGSVSKKK